MSTPENIAPSPTAIPRWLAGIIITAIALASLVALIWPLLPSTKPVVGPSPGSVGVISGQIEGEGMRGGIGAKAPDFEYVSRDGTTVRLSDYQGKIVVVNFWATWCRPCVQELPAMNRVAASDPDVVFLAVASTGLRDTSEKVDSFFTELALDHITPVLDEGIATLNRYGVHDLPTSFFVARDGVIRHFQIGILPLTDDQIKRGIAKAKVGSNSESAPAVDLRWLLLAVPLVAGGFIGLRLVLARRHPPRGVS
jgi:thiol-disulfide isomerase/thioredoxin